MDSSVSDTFTVQYEILKMAQVTILKWQMLPCVREC